MQKVEILVIGTTEDILKVIVRLINANPWWNATGSSGTADAKVEFLVKDFDLVLFGAGLTEEEETLLITEFNVLKPDVPTIKHYGGGSGLLFAEIYQALK